MLRSEGTWTTPRDECPHPTYWHALDKNSTEIEVSEMLYGLVRGLQPDYAVETGTWKGQTTEHMAKAIARNGHGHLHAVELVEAMAAQCRERCRGLPVTVHEADVLEWEPSAPIDFLWIDAGTAQENRVDQLDHFRPWLHAQSVVALHDCGPQFGVRGALETRARDFEWLFLATPRGIALGKASVG